MVNKHSKTATLKNLLDSVCTLNFSMDRLLGKSIPVKEKGRDGRAMENQAENGKPDCGKEGTGSCHTTAQSHSRS